MLSVCIALTQLTPESLHGDQKYSDFTVICGSETFKLHKCVVLPQSKALQTLYETSLATSSASPIRDGRGRFRPRVEPSSPIELKDIDPKIFQLLVRYFYLGKCADDPTIPCNYRAVRTNKRRANGDCIVQDAGPSPPAMMYYLKVLVLGNKLGCHSRLASIIRVDFCSLAAAFWYTDEFLDAARFIHRSVDGPDKEVYMDIIIKTLSRNQRRLLDVEARQMVDEIGITAKLLFQTVADNERRKHRSKG